jgi:hypothetical protein
MSYTYLQEQGEESSAASFSDIDPYVRWKLILTDEVCFYSVSGMEYSRSFPFGMTYGRLYPFPGKGQLISYVRDSPASDTATSERSTGAMGLTAGQTHVASYRKSVQGSFSWKMSQQSFEGFGGKSLETCPRWGLTRGGECFQLAPLVCHIHGKGCSAWRTPAASDAKRRNLDWPSVRKPGNPLCLPQQIAQRGFHGYLNPQFQAVLMGWPNTWANLKPLETAKFQQWLDSHGKH